MSEMIIEQLNEEIAKTLKTQTEYDRLTAVAQKEYDKAAKAAGRKPKDEELAAAAERIHNKLMRAINGGTACSSRLVDLRHPSELERRLHKVAKRDESLSKLRERKAAQQEQGGVGARPAKKVSGLPRDQGFPPIYLAENGKFQPGQDSRAKSDLCNSVLGIKTPEMKHQFKKQEALRLLELRDWMGYLDRKRKAKGGK